MSSFLVGKNVFNLYRKLYFHTFCYVLLLFLPLLFRSLLHSFQLKAALSNVKWRSALPEQSTFRLWLQETTSLLWLCVQQWLIFGCHRTRGSTGHGAGRTAFSGAPAPFHGGSGPTFPSYSGGMRLSKGKNGEDRCCHTAPPCSMATGAPDLRQLEVKMLGSQFPSNCRAPEQSTDWKARWGFEWDVQLDCCFSWCLLIGFNSIWTWQ